MSTDGGTQEELVIHHDEQARNRLVNPRQLAELWGCSRAHVYVLMGQGLPSLTLGRARRIRLADADEWLQDRTSIPTGS
jgi:predicted DNA-binding transcriptional regulator AlpA